MEQKNILNEVLQKCKDKDGKKYINCPDALEIAKKNNLKPAEITKVLNRHKIKIINCQLGCF
ncbi:MAG: hypothetical protein KJ607_04390 [Bacteroidetes bacterium]|nr:hypothetical protein [Bacteroidota bacterium]